MLSDQVWHTDKAGEMLMFCTMVPENNEWFSLIFLCQVLPKGKSYVKTLKPKTYDLESGYCTVQQVDRGILFFSHEVLTCILRDIHANDSVSKKSLLRQSIDWLR